MKKYLEGEDTVLYFMEEQTLLFDSRRAKDIYIPAEFRLYMAFWKYTNQTSLFKPIAGKYSNILGFVNNAVCQLDHPVLFYSSSGH